MKENKPTDFDGPSFFKPKSRRMLWICLLCFIAGLALAVYLKS